MCRNSDQKPQIILALPADGNHSTIIRPKNLGTYWIDPSRILGSFQGDSWLDEAKCHLQPCTALKVPMPKKLLLSLQMECFRAVGARPPCQVQSAAASISSARLRLARLESGLYFFALISVKPQYTRRLRGREDRCARKYTAFPHKTIAQSPPSVSRSTRPFAPPKRNATTSAIAWTMKLAQLSKIMLWDGSYSGVKTRERRASRRSGCERATLYDDADPDTAAELYISSLST
ncbi:hypothetical protein DFH06DRAFT_1128212 [Mycena polygramma]|nr:hypothetical protein DFH06DRAFT_1128212 [Mycena polygramma]